MVFKMSSYKHLSESEESKRKADRADRDKVAKQMKRSKYPEPSSIRCNEGSKQIPRKLTITSFFRTIIRGGKVKRDWLALLKPTTYRTVMHVNYFPNEQR